MRLTCIQLAGFKSFVEPTVLSFTGNRTAIVGPNGCGKSNVIDAVRWVMGESSAKHLRGDAMTDVIFNGSASRRSHGMASVELVFDNTDKRLPGQYAALNSLSIKRRLSRDGDNQFFINGEKCRRRDVTDLFSGTGLGPRAYAIIEQGTIARLIDAKPDELRGFIEEAAGLSKYKERRRETTSRMEHSRDNLARLRDISQEVQQQIDRLTAQAQAADQFRLLKTRIRATHTQLKALQWQGLQSALADAHNHLHSLAQQQAQAQTQLEANQQQQLALQDAQADCLVSQDYANGQVLALNQAIAEHLSTTALAQAHMQMWRQQEQELSQEMALSAALLADRSAEQQTRQDQINALAANLEAHNRARELKMSATQAAADQLQQQQLALSASAQALQDCKDQLLIVGSQKAQLGGQIERAAEQVALRQAALVGEQKALEGGAHADAITPVANLDTLKAQLEILVRERATLSAQHGQVARARAYLAGRLGRPADSGNPAQTPLPEGPWSDTWAAAEPWLQPWISARPWSDSWEAAGRQVAAPAFLIRPQADTHGIVRWLASWQSVADQQAALTALKAQPDGVFYTPAGEVFAKDWLYLPAPGQSRFSLSERLATVVQLEDEQQHIQGQLESIDSQIDQLNATLAEVQAFTLRQELVSQIRAANLNAAQAEYEHAQRVHQDQLAARASLFDELAHLDQKQLQLQRDHTAGLQELTKAEQLHTQCVLQERELSEASEQVNAELRELHSAQQAAQPEQLRLGEQIDRLGLKLRQLRAQIDQGVQQDAPLQQLKAQLADAVAGVQTLKERYASGDKSLKTLHLLERQQRQQAEQLRIAQEASTLAANTVQTQLNSLQAEPFDISAALAMLPAHATDEQLQQQLRDDKDALDALGPVNLAALDEYEQACTRAAYLHEQQTDLHQALECLENAIKQIDRESRQRFKQTFDGANEGLQSLFPQVFAGGSAYLELTGEDLLTAGVAIMARPPGKKNSTIHLLSGGEKALTALALVFALFRLNPAPFCLLDEVDAPLDDANVGRFARLVEAMAEQVQFIFITHNKIAMEMAEHLLGVTMQEPGVSRVVSVDIAHAAQLAAD